MREINDQYPEYAEPYEPVKGGKHHKGIYGTRRPERRNSSKRFLFFALIGLLLLLLVSTRPGGEMPGTEPQTDEKKTVVTSETKSEEPSEPDTPEPPINPEEHKDIPETPEEPKKPEEPAAPETPASTSSSETPDSPDEPDESEDSPETSEPEDEPVSPTEPDLPVEPEEPTYKDPTVSIAHVYYWYCLGHIEVEYKITANDGESITSYSTVTSMRDPSMTVSMPSKTGAGTIDANADGYGKITYMSADEWKTDVTLAYTLNGESKTLTVSNTAQPEFMDFLWLDPQYLSGNSSTTNKVVSDTIKVRYGKNDRHTYDVSFAKIEMGWMKEVPLSGGGYTYEEVGSTKKTVWDGTGTSPITGPAGPTADGDYKVLTFDYHDLLNVVPPADAAGATHFYLDYYMKGTGTDTDGTVYTIHEPTFGRSTPCEIEKDLEVEINYIYLWDELNHIEVGYTITPGDAENITSIATVTSYIDSSKTITMTEQAGSGKISVNADGSDKLWWHHSGDSWTVEVVLNYTMHGENRTRTVSATMPPEFKGNLSLYGLGVSGSGTDVDSQAVTADIVFEYPADDRHKYNINVTRIDIGWKDKNGEKIGSTRTVWNGSNPSPVTNPAGPVIDGDHKNLTFHYEGTLNATSPADVEGATHYYLIFYTEGTGKDVERDGHVYTVRRPTSIELASIPLPGVTLVEPEVSFDHLYWYAAVDHMELGYSVTANDADVTSLSSQATITFDPWPGEHRELTMPEVNGADNTDSITVEKNNGEELFIQSSGPWVTTITLRYMLGGELKEKKIEVPLNPEIILPEFDPISVETSGSINELDLSCDLNLVNEAGDEHEYSLDFTKVEIEWLQEDTIWGYTTLGSETIWNKETGDGDAFEFLSRGQNSDGNKEVKYSFALDDVDATPSDPTATKFRLIFDANISGNHAVYDTIGEFMHHTTEVVDLPAWEDPTVTGVNVLWWDEIYHLMVRYNIDKKDADVDEHGLAIIKSEAVLSDGSDTCSMGEVGGDGDIEVSKIGVNLPDYNYRPMMDSNTVNVTIYLSYELGGEEKTKSFTFANCPINKMAPTLTGAVHSSTQSGRTLDMEDYRIELNKPGGDPHSYNLEFIEVGIIWYTADGDYRKTIWNAGYGYYPFTGDGPYTYSDTIDIMPPDPDCTHYSLWFNAIAEGNDEFDSNDSGINLSHETEKWKLPDIY